MKNIHSDKTIDNKILIDAVIARVTGAVQVASATVAKTIAIKDEAVDDVEALRTKSNTKTEDIAIKKIKAETKNVLGKR